MAKQIDPKNVVGRAALIAQIWRLLQTSAGQGSLRLTAERRIGKTTVMTKMTAETLMRLRLEIKNQRGRSLRLAARFLRAWFPVEKLQESVGKLADGSRAADYCQAPLLTDNSFEEVIDDDLLAMILSKCPSEWSDYVAAITPLYVKHNVTEKLGRGIAQSIKYLDAGGFSESQREIWNEAWQTAGKDCDDLQIPLACLDAAVAVMKSDPPTDRPLFRLPLEIRQLVRPMLDKSLGPVDTE